MTLKLERFSDKMLKSITTSLVAKVVLFCLSISEQHWQNLNLTKHELYSVITLWKLFSSIFACIKPWYLACSTQLQSKFLEQTTRGYLTKRQDSVTKPLPALFHLVVEFTMMIGITIKPTGIVISNQLDLNTITIFSCFF